MPVKSSGCSSARKRAPWSPPFLLVGEHDEDEVAGQRDVLPLRSQERVHEHRDAALHVERAAAPEIPVDQPALERRVRPALPARGDDVDVTLEEKRRRAAASRATRFGRPGTRSNVLSRSPRLEQAADELDARGLVAGRVRRVEPDQRLRQLDDVHASSSSASKPVDLVLRVVVHEAGAHGAGALEPEQLHDLDRVVVAVPDRDLPRRQLGRDLLGRASGQVERERRHAASIVRSP